MASRWRQLSRNGIAVAIGATAVMIVVAFVFNWLANRTITDTGSLDLPSFTATASASADPGDATLLAVGDIADCDSQADDRVAALAAELPGTIALTGDLVYPKGTAANYRKCFEPSWGPMLSRIRPALGNHDYTGNGSAQPYFNLFGTAAGTKGEGWYSYELGTWHVVVLNSNCNQVGCEAGSPQMSWLESDLAAHPNACLLAYWHHPRWSSGRHGNQEEVDPFWQALTQAGVDVVINGHDHDYERLDVDGVMEFVVGTGGKSLYVFERDPYPSTATRQDKAYGLLELQLRGSSFEWQYLVLGKSGFTDQGAGSC